jgi:hypothetical protein
MPGRPTPPPRPLLAVDTQSSRQDVTRRLTTEQTERYRPWIENDRRIRELVARLEAIGINHLESAPPR